MDDCMGNNMFAIEVVVVVVVVEEEEEESRQC